MSWCKTIKDEQVAKGFTEVKIPVVETSGLFAQLDLAKAIRIDFFHFVPAE